MKRAKRQDGATLIGWLLIMVIVAFVALIGMKLVPVYLDSFTVTSILRSMKTDATLKGQGRSAILETLNKRLDINDIDSVKPDDISIRTVAGGTEVDVDYEDRVNLLGNLDAVATFHKKVVIPD